MKTRADALQDIVQSCADFITPWWGERDGIYYPMAVHRHGEQVRVRCGHVERTVHNGLERRADFIDHIEALLTDVTTTYRRAVSDQGEV